MGHSSYLPEDMGSATVSPTGAFEAGSYQEFTVTYTAGKFGIDDTGSIKIVHRFASDMGRPQFDDPGAPNYTTVEASNGAVLQIEYDIKRNIRPWDKTLYVKVVRGYLSQGDTITIRFGDRRQGSPGIRLQTFCEETFEFRVLVDAIATYTYTELPQQPEIAIVPGPARRYKAVLPTLRRAGQPFRLCLKGEDKWGNPSNRAQGRFALRANLPVAGLPAEATFADGDFTVEVAGLTVTEPGDLVIELVAEDGTVAAASNPLRIVAAAELLPYWGDLHGQSEETIGTNSARDYFSFARDKAFLDATCHQGNDFQITKGFWDELNRLTAEFDEPGRFVAFPGYEWSGNTALGGDRNVLYLQEGRPIRRSSHALVDDLSDADTDAHTAAELFEKLDGEDVVVFAHVGGRYADIKLAHDGRIERGVEVHSAWGTFEWIVHDAFEQGYRVGILANSDGHKGRPGASHPGATKFGSYGGLTCMLATELSRAGLAAALRQRHHYATTGCRMVLNVAAEFDTPATRFVEDPALGPTTGSETRTAMMGDILQSGDGDIAFRVDLVGSAPVERVEIRNGLDTIETIRPYGRDELGTRIRVIWEGSEYRGRGRETIWDGHAELSGNRFTRLAAINRYNVDKRYEQTGADRVDWVTLTTGGIGGFDAWLDDGQAGSLRIDTALVQAEIPIAEIGYDDLVFDAGGLGRRIRVFRLPDANPHRAMTIERRLTLVDDRDNALYVCITQEDGHMIWSSPIYVFR